ncbi:MAG: beta-N-acetylhexosaminidase [Lysobacteraceae bacterium]
MLIIGIAGTQLLAEERDWLAHPAVSGVILFSRNFASREQVTALAAEIRAAAPRPMLLCVDQEGGPVQRFRDGFSTLPALAGFGERVRVDADGALAAARQHAYLMASEIRALGIDLSFAPVVDLGRGNRAIGERAFSADPATVAAFTKAYVQGMHEAGMAATLKHFPGHGSVLEDTHFDDAIDPRPLPTLEAEDLLPFRAGIAAGAEAVMLAHVRYPAVDADPAGYSRRWIGDILRRQMGFSGIAISDDIGMAAAHSAGGVAARLSAHIDAGCDLVLVCAPDLVADSLAAVERIADPRVVARLAGRPAADWQRLQTDPRYLAAQRAVLDPETRLA